MDTYYSHALADGVAAAEMYLTFEERKRGRWMMDLGRFGLVWV
jgi:hypothetical protein